MYWGGRDLWLSVCQSVQLFSFSGVGAGRRADQVVSLKGCGTDWRGPAQPSEAAATHPWKKLPTRTDVTSWMLMPLKPTLSPGTAVSSALLLGLPHWLLGPQERASVALGFSEVEIRISARNGNETLCFMVPSTFPHHATQGAVPTRQDEQGLGCLVARCTDCGSHP